MKNQAATWLMAACISVFAASASTFTVTTTSDQGAGSLRQAILDANATSGPDVIQFNISPPGEKTITPASALPAITEMLEIDGTTQPGFTSKPIIEISGASVLTTVDGLRITTSDCVIKGVVINRWRGDGIEISGGGNNRIEGSIIGLDLAGEADVGNSFNGVLIVNSSNNHVIGGNVISGNNGSGVRIDGATSTGNIITGNIIGLNLAGGVDRGNAVNGVYINQAVNTIVGGETPEKRNIISGNDSMGVLIEGVTSQSNQVQGNYIGTNIQGIADLGNSVDGVKIINSSSNNIGSTAPDGGNIISGNNSIGLEITGSGAFGNTIRGNKIGIDINGNSLPNTSHGVLLVNGANGNTVGGADGANTIAFNGGDGVFITSSANNRVRMNSIHSNTGLGIDLDPNGVTGNDANDADTGANQRQNFPILSTAIANISDTQITGTLNSTPNTTFDLDFFSNPTADPSGSGEAQQYLGSTTVTTDATGNARFDVTLPTAATGKFLSATATDPDGNTSESSPNLGIASTVQGQTFTVTNTENSGAGSLRQAILDANAVFAKNTIDFNIPGDGPHIITPSAVLPPIQNTVVINGYSQPGAAQNTSSEGFTGTVKIVLSGSAIASSVDGLNVQWPGVEIRGLNIILFRSDGIEIAPSAYNTIIEGCLIGIALNNSDQGCNVAGIFINSSLKNRVGGASDSARNVISGNGNAGILIDGTAARENVIQGNQIGSNLAGLAAVANSQDGIRISNSSNNIIGGTEAAARNLISGNTGEGIDITGASAMNNLVQGNWIGTDVTSLSALANSSHGVNIAANASGNTIGGTESNAGNRIAFNGGDGIYVDAGQNNQLRGNSITSNNGLGIDLNLNGVTANDTNDPDIGANLRQNFPILSSATANSGDTVIKGPSTAWLPPHFKSIFLVVLPRIRPAMAKPSSILARPPLRRTVPEMRILT